MRALIAVDEDSLFEDVLATLRWCLRLRDGDDLLVLHVSPDVWWMPPAPATHSSLDSVRGERDDVAERVLSAARSLLSSWSIRAEYCRGNGHPAAEILRTAQDWKADLIVMGARGTEERGFLMGSTSQKVKALARTDVLVVRRGRPPEGRPFRALLAVDGSAESTGAVESFARTTQADRADVRVVHVIDLPPTAWDICVPDEPLDVASLPAPLRNYVNRALDGALGVLQAHRITATTEVRRGRAAAEILSAAVTCRAHLMVVGSRGLSGIRGLLLGSAAQRVVRHGTCSVLIGRPSGSARPPAA